MLNMTMGNSLFKAAETLNAAITKSLNDGYTSGFSVEWKEAHQKNNGDPYPQNAFGNTALVVLNEYKNSVNLALEKLATGDWKPLWRMSSMYTGLSKQMDYDFDWMTPENKDAVYLAMDNLIGVASEISLIGYELNNATT
jgi:hypothetical protein